MKQIITKDDRAVSPIIVAILLIIIAVIVVATFYAELGGIKNGSSSGNSKASVSFVEISPYNYVLSVKNITGNISLASVVLQVFNGTYSAKVNLGIGAPLGYLKGLGATTSTISTNNVTYNINKGGSKYLSLTTSIALKNTKKSGTNKWGNVTITSIILINISTSNVLTTSTQPSISTGNPVASISFVETSPDNYSLSVNSISGNISLSSVVLEVFNGTYSASVNLGTGVQSGQLNGMGNSKITTQDEINYTINNSGSNYLSPTTSITLMNDNSSGHWDNISITSIILKDILTNSALTTSTPPAPSIIVAQAVFKID